MKRRKKLMIKFLTYIAIITIAFNYARIGAEKAVLSIVLENRNHILFEQEMRNNLSNSIISYNGFVILP